MRSPEKGATLALSVKPGDLIDDRFEVEREAGAGGMGTIYRTRDRRDGASVAVKVLRAHDGPAKERFEREAQVLAELDHPGIVRYVAHGAATSGAMYLAMEWLEGEDLERRLRRDALTVAEGVALAARVADALGAAHARAWANHACATSSSSRSCERST